MRPAMRRGAADVAGAWPALMAPVKMACGGPGPRPSDGARARGGLLRRARREESEGLGGSEVAAPAYGLWKKLRYMRRIGDE